MKKLALLLIPSLLYITSIGQEFSFYLKVEDNAGNIDSVMLGYDDNSSIGFDATWNENDLTSTPWNGGFEVRVSNSGDEIMGGNQAFSPTFASSVQIIDYNCDNASADHSDFIFIDVKTSDWPITVSWEKEPFLDTCRLGTYIFPLGIADAGFHLGEMGELTFGEFDISMPYSGYVDGTDTIGTFGFAFGDSLSWISSVPTIEKLNFSVSPNPCNESLRLDLKNNNRAVQISAYDFTGKQIHSSSSFDQRIEIQTSEWKSGVYFLKIDDGIHHRTEKVIKL